MMYFDQGLARCRREQRLLQTKMICKLIFATPEETHDAIKNMIVHLGVRTFEHVLYSSFIILFQVHSKIKVGVHISVAVTQTETYNVLYSDDCLKMFLLDCR